MKALIMILENIKENTLHPILYFESPLPGRPDHIVRFKSKGHRTVGLIDKPSALKAIQEGLIDKLSKYQIYTDLDNGYLPWDGEDIPVDIQFRSPESLKPLIHG